MKKNILIKLFAILFAMILPISAFAGSLDEYRLEQIQAGKELEMDISVQTMHGLMANEDGEDWLADLTKAILLTIRGSNDKALTKLSLNGEPVLNIVSEITENGEVYVALQEIETVLKLAKVEKASKVEIGEIKDVKDLLKVDLEALQNVEPTGDEKLDLAIQNIMKNTTIEDVTEQDDKFDKAEKVLTQKLTKEDSINIMESKAVLDSIKANPALSSQGINPEDITEVYKSGAMQLEGYNKFYLDGENYIVAIESPFTFTVDQSKLPKKDLESSEASEEETPSTIKDINLEMNYYRKTEAPVINHNLTMNVALGENKVMSFEGTVKEEENKKADTVAKLILKPEEGDGFVLDIIGSSNFGESKNDGYYTFVVNKDTDGALGAIIDFNSELNDGKITNKISLAMKNDLDNLGMSDSDMKLGTLTIVEKYEDKMDFPSFDKENAINIENMDQATESKLGQAVQSLIPMILEKLPESFVNFIAPPTPVEE